MTDHPLRLDHLTSKALGAWVQRPHPVVLWPVGSVEPHGPHLPLDTDTTIALKNAELAAQALRAQGVAALVAPPLPYGVTEFARDFPGAISVPGEVLVGLLEAGAVAFFRSGFRHLCIINHHLEPGQLAALAEARRRIAEAHGPHAVSLPAVVSRRWGGQLGAEFRSGACHAGRYEGSLVLAVTPERVDLATAASLPEVAVSLSAAIGAGATSFVEAGAHQAYTGSPQAASAAEGASLYAVLASMVATEVLESLEKLPA